MINDMDIFKILNKKYGKCCSYCGKRHKKLYLHSSIGRKVCKMCFELLNSYIRA